MDNIKDLLIGLGYVNQVEMATAINMIDDRFGGGSDKSWGGVTEDDWRNHSSLVYVTEGNKEEILSAYTALRRSGVLGWLPISTKNWQSYSLWKPS